MIKLLKAEKKIRHKELKFAESPHSARTYEKAILVSPNSSFLWIKFAAFSFDCFGIDKAREVLQKALVQVDSTEEREKLNLYFALINLEHSFGTAESFEKAVLQAIAVSSHEKILQHKARKLLQSNSLEETEETLRLICRKFSKNVENWEKLLLFYVKDCKDEQKFQEVLRRGLQSLRDPIELKKRIGIIEYNNGSPEKGRTIFENLITEKPKRSDIWTVYIGLEAKFNTFEAVRDLYERVLSGKLSQKCGNAFAKAFYGYEVAQKHWNKAKEVAERFNLECKQIF